MIGILVTGARDWDDEKLVYNCLLQFKELDVTLIHGGCVGLDQIAGKVANTLGFNVNVILPQWSRYGRAAGPIRNKTMIEELLKYDTKYMFAFHDNVDKSRGTKNCVAQAKKLGINPIIYSH